MVGDHSDMIVQRIDFNLQVAVVVQQSGVAVASTLQLLSHVHDLVLLGSDSALELFNGVGEIDVFGAF